MCACVYRNNVPAACAAGAFLHFGVAGSFLKGCMFESICYFCSRFTFSHICCELSQREPGPTVHQTCCISPPTTVPASSFCCSYSLKLNSFLGTFTFFPHSSPIHVMQSLNRAWSWCKIFNSKLQPMLPLIPNQN